MGGSRNRVQNRSSRRKKKDYRKNNKTRSANNVLRRYPFPHQRSISHLSLRPGIWSRAARPLETRIVSTLILTTLFFPSRYDILLWSIRDAHQGRVPGRAEYSFPTWNRGYTNLFVFSCYTWIYLYKGHSDRYVMKSDEDFKEWSMFLKLKMLLVDKLLVRL